MNKWFGKSAPVRTQVYPDPKNLDSKTRISSGYELAAELSKNRMPQHLLQRYKDTVGWEQQGPQGRLHARLALFELAQSIAQRSDVGAAWWRLLDEHLPVPKTVWTRHVENEDASRQLSSYKEQGQRARAKIDSLKLERDHLRLERSNLQEELRNTEDVLDEAQDYNKALEAQNTKLQACVDVMTAVPPAPVLRRARPGSGLISGAMIDALANMGPGPVPEIEELDESRPAHATQEQTGAASA